MSRVAQCFFAIARQHWQYTFLATTSHFFFYFNYKEAIIFHTDLHNSFINDVLRIWCRIQIPFLSLLSSLCICADLHSDTKVSFLWLCLFCYCDALSRVRCAVHQRGPTVTKTPILNTSAFVSRYGSSFILSTLSANLYFRYCYYTITKPCLDWGDVTQRSRLFQPHRSNVDIHLRDFCVIIQSVALVC